MEMFRVSSQATQAQTSPFQQWQQTTADIAGSARQQDQRLIARHIEEAFLSVYQVAPCAGIPIAVG
jgi:hypothetical protein